jgi:hypothetical protein
MVNGIFWIYLREDAFPMWQNHPQRLPPILEIQPPRQSLESLPIKHYERINNREGGLRLCEAQRMLVTQARWAEPARAAGSIVYPRRSVLVR